MTPVNRRTFLGSAAALGAAVGLDVLPFGAAEAQAATSGTITDVKHIVVLMQENRSFDHYFGTLSGVRGFGDRSTVQLTGGYSVFNQVNGSGRQYPWQLSDNDTWWFGTSAESIAQCDGSLDHGWSSQHSAWNNGRMDNWISAKGSNRTMGYLARADIPFHYALADAYTVCDAYHCSVLSATGPNRTYLWSGTIDPNGTAGGPAYDGGDESGLKWQTYAEVLEAAGISWKVYQNASDNYGDNGLAYFTQFSGASTSSALYQKGMSSVPSKSGSTPDDIAAAIQADVTAGTLPQVSWIVADQAHSEHPDAPPNDGAHFVNQVINALAANADVFNSTVLFLNYDENDGFFDHVPPPAPPAGTADEFCNGAPLGLGFRVPMVIVSPWTRGGWVNSQVSDHTSVIRFMETWSAAIGRPAKCGTISAWRRKVCGDLTSAFDFTKPVYGLPSLPSVSASVHQAACTVVPNPGPKTNALPAQESGTRPARALPYQPDASVNRLESGANGKTLLWIDLANLGATATSAAHFSVHANAYRTGGPWQYTVAANGTATDSFDIGSGYGDGKYDFSVFGPNRFLRRVTGDAGASGRTAEVTSGLAAATGTSRTALWLTFTNTGTGAVTFTVKSDNYRTDGPWTYTVPAGGSTQDVFDAVAKANGWYDFTVTVSGDTSWSRRFVGHIETGAASVTG